MSVFRQKAYTKKYVDHRQTTILLYNTFCFQFCQEANNINQSIQSKSFIKQYYKYFCEIDCISDILIVDEENTVTTDYK